MAFTKSVILSLVVVAGLQAHAASASATQINTGGETGAYHASFCPALAGQLKLAQFDYRCAPSAGTRENMDRVAADPRQLGYGQLDVFALESRQMKAEDAFTIVRQDDVRECVFAVTRNKQITNWGELSVNAGNLRFILPPATSGSAGTFQFLRTIDADGLGRAKTVTHAGIDRGCHPPGAERRRHREPVRRIPRSRKQALRAGAQAGRPSRPGDRSHHPAPGDRRHEDLLPAGDRDREAPAGSSRPASW